MNKTPLANARNNALWKGGSLKIRFYPPKTKGDMAELSGYVPVSTLGDYQTQISSYTSGRGRMMLTLKGYEPCHNANEIIANMGYDSEADLDNPTGSIFCSHGAGFLVKWDEVENYMHLNNEWSKDKDNHDINSKIVSQQTKPAKSPSYRGTLEEDKELERKVHHVINTLKFIVEWAGFEFIGRIKIRDKKSGREFK